MSLKCVSFSSLWLVGISLLLVCRLPVDGAALNPGTTAKVSRAASPDSSSSVPANSGGGKTVRGGALAAVELKVHDRGPGSSTSLSPDDSEDRAEAASPTSAPAAASCTSAEDSSEDGEQASLATNDNQELSAAQRPPTKPSAPEDVNQEVPLDTVSWDRCPPGYTEKKSSCYKVLKGPFHDYVKARDACKSRTFPASTLLTINNNPLKLEDAYLLSQSETHEGLYISGMHLFSGASDQHCEAAKSDEQKSKCWGLVQGRIQELSCHMDKARGAICEHPIITGRGAVATTHVKKLAKKDKKRQRLVNDEGEEERHEVLGRGGRKKDAPKMDKKTNVVRLDKPRRSKVLKVAKKGPEFHETHTDDSKVAVSKPAQDVEKERIEQPPRTKTVESPTGPERFKSGVELSSNVEAHEDPDSDGKRKDRKSLSGERRPIAPTEPEKAHFVAALPEDDAEGVSSAEDAPDEGAKDLAILVDEGLAAEKVIDEVLTDLLMAEEDGYRKGIF